MTQKDLFSKIVTGTDRGVEANISLARALTKSTESALTFTYSTESGEWSAAGELAKNNIIRYKTPNNQPIGLKDTEEFMSMKLGLQIVNPIVGDEQFDESTGEWVAKYKKEITVMGGSTSTQLAYPLITKVNEAKTETIDSYITSVTLPTSVTTLDMSTLAYISGLTNLQIPYSVTSIKGNAITSCYNLTGITYPGTMAEWQGGKITVSPGWAYGTPIHVIECSDGKIYLNTINVDYTTTDGNALTLSSAPFAGPVVDNIYTSTGGTIVVGKSGSTFPIMANAFDGQETLQSITLPSSTTSIGVDAFRLCHKLTGITIPSSVTTIGDYAFHACTGLTTFTLPNTVTSVGVGTLYACTGITDPVFNNKIFVTMRRNATGSYTVPDGIETIAGGAFQWHTGLSAITLPSTVTTIGKEAFDNCNGMEVLTVEATTPPSVTTGALLGLPADCDIYVPVGCVSAYEAAPEWSARTGHIKEPAPAVELVDLGLSVKWTKYNLGATHGDTPESWYGNYYAWGETDVKSGYNGNNYKYGSYTWNAGGNEWITNTLSKYNTQSQYGETDNKTLLEESDDVAYSQGLRTPTFSEIMELLDNTKIKKEWKANYSGVTNLNGALFTSLVAGFEGNSVFIPAAAVKNDNGTSFVGIGGHIRSSQINESDPGFARIIIFGYSEGQFFTVDDIDERCLGVPVRGVSE